MRTASTAGLSSSAGRASLALSSLVSLPKVLAVVLLPFLWNVYVEPDLNGIAFE
jgi:hypothetical protein